MANEESKTYSSEFWCPSVVTDCVIFGFTGKQLKVLLIKRNVEPYKDCWALPGGFLRESDKTAEECALRELQEETGVKYAQLVSEEIFSLETLTVDGHMRKGLWVPSHLHFNLTYLAEADENEELVVQEAENSAVQWWPFEEALNVSTEPWMIQNIYKKLIERSR